ncbi:MAG: TonB-dependent receptor [Bacteroidia bacterium]|nr:TonB-dependent receptor [Bacteroidia bacterium]
MESNVTNGKVTVEPVKNFRISTVAALQRYTNLGGTYANRNYANGDTYNGQAYRNTDFNEQRTLEIIGDYTHQIKQHNFNWVAGYSYQHFKFEGYNAYNYNFPTDLFGYNQLNLGLALQNGLASMGSYKSMSKLIAFFGRMNYSFDNRYLLSATIRHEGSSKFGKNHKRGDFYAVSGGWRLIQEDFYP